MRDGCTEPRSAMTASRRSPGRGGSRINLSVRAPCFAQIVQHCHTGTNSLCKVARAAFFQEFANENGNKPFELEAIQTKIGE